MVLRCLVYLIMLSNIVLVSAVFARTEHLNLYVWEGYAPDQQVKKFQSLIKEKYNINLRMNIHYIKDVHDFFHVLRRKQADIISPSHNLLKDERFRLIDTGLVLPLDLNNIPHYTQLLPHLKKAKFKEKEGKIYTIPFIQGTYSLIYNTAVFTTPPKTWKVLWEPAYQNNYALSEDYYETNIYITALALGYSKKDLGNYKKLNNNLFKEKLRQLAKNTRNFWQGVDTVDDIKGLALATSWGFSLSALEKQGEIWKRAEPKEGAAAWVDSFSLGYRLADKPLLKKIAEEWINYSLSAKYQYEVVVKNLHAYPVNAQVKQYLSAEEIAHYHLDDNAFFDKKWVLWPTLSKRNRNAIKSLWNKARK